MQQLLRGKRANTLAQVLQGICYLLVALAVMTMTLVAIGRMQVDMMTPLGYFDHALLIEKDHATNSRFLFASLSDLSIQVNTINADGNVHWLTWLGVAGMGFLTVAPIGYCFYLMARFFGHISRDKVFDAANAKLLLRGGIVLVAAAIAVPLLNGYLLPALINAFTANVISTAVSMNVTSLFVGLVLLVMAYVFNHGLYLQREADYTL